MKAKNRKIAYDNTYGMVDMSVYSAMMAQDNRAQLGRLKRNLTQALRRRLKNLRDRGVVLREGQTLRDLYNERTPLYEKYADLVIDESGLSLEQTREALERELREKR